MQDNDGVNLMQFLDEKFAHLAAQMAEVKDSVRDVRRLYDDVILRYSEQIMALSHKVSAVEENAAINKASYKELSKRVDDLRLDRSKRLENWLSITGRLVLAAVVAWALARLSNGAL